MKLQEATDTLMNRIDESIKHLQRRHSKIELSRNTDEYKWGHEAATDDAVAELSELRKYFVNKA